MSGLGVAIRVIITIVDTLIGMISFLAVRQKPGETPKDRFIEDVLLFIGIAMVMNIIAIWTI